MPKHTKHARILEFPSGVSLVSARVDDLQEVMDGRHQNYILDYQELNITPGHTLTPVTGWFYVGWHTTHDQTFVLYA